MILPKRHFDVLSPLDPQRVQDALAPYVGPPSPLTRAPYLGLVTVAGFELRPQIKGRNTFVPFVSGQVLPTAQGSRVVVTMKMGTIARVFMSVWLSMAAAFLLLTSGMAITMGIRGESGGVVVFSGLFLFCSGFPIGGILMARSGFRREADPLERFLREVFRAPPAPPYR